MANGFHILKYSRPDSKQPFFCMMSKGEDPKRKKEKEKRRKEKRRENLSHCIFLVTFVKQRNNEYIRGTDSKTVEPGED